MEVKSAVSVRRLNSDVVSFQSQDDDAFIAAQAQRASLLYRAQSVPVMPKEARANWTPKSQQKRQVDAATSPPLSATSAAADEELRLLDKQMNRLKLSPSSSTKQQQSAPASANGSPVPPNAAVSSQPGSTTRSPSSAVASNEGSPSSAAREGQQESADNVKTMTSKSVAPSTSAILAVAASSAPTASAAMAAAATAPEFAMGSASSVSGEPSTNILANFANAAAVAQHGHAHGHMSSQQMLHHPTPQHHPMHNPYHHHSVRGQPQMGAAAGLHHPAPEFVAPPAVPSPAFYNLTPDMMRPQQPLHMQQWQPMTYAPQIQRPATTGPNPQAQICKFFAQGSCAKGDQCTFLHVFATKATSMVGAKMTGAGAATGAAGMPYPQQPSVGAFDNGDGGFAAGGPGSTASGLSGRRGLGAESSTNTSPRPSSVLPGNHSPPLNRSGRFTGQRSVGAFSNTRSGHGGANGPPSPVPRPFSSMGPMSGAGNGAFEDFVARGRFGANGAGDVGVPGPLGRVQSSFLSGEMPGAGAGGQDDYGFLTPRANPNPYLNGDQPMTARDIATQVYILAKDQHGCRLLQRMLEDRDKLTFEVIFTEVFRHINELMTDPFGNYLIQKLMEFATDEQRLKILHKVAHDLVAISLNIHGTRVVQKMLEVMTTDSEKQLVVRATRSSVVTLTKDLNGNHVIQRCLQHMEAEYNQFIYDAISMHCVSVATHKHGCCVLQRCIDFAVERQRIQLISVIVTNALELVQDAFGNYVVQYVIDNAGRQVSRALMKQLLGSISNLAVQKFSSNVIEKCLQNADDDIKVCIIDELIDPQRLPRLLQDPYANYVIQKALSVTKQERFNYLIELIRPHVRALRATSFGKRIQSKIIKRFPILAMDDPPMGPADHSRINAY